VEYTLILPVFLAGADSLRVATRSMVPRTVLAVPTINRDGPGGFRQVGCKGPAGPGLWALLKTRDGFSHPNTNRPASGAGGTGHLCVSCRADRCASPSWYRPRHREGSEIGSRPGG
jgi:hypothetical protein